MSAKQRLKRLNTACFGQQAEGAHALQQAHSDQEGAPAEVPEKEQQAPKTDEALEEQPSPFPESLEQPQQIEPGVQVLLAFCDVQSCSWQARPVPIAKCLNPFQLILCRKPVESRCLAIRSANNHQLTCLQMEAEASVIFMQSL